MQTYMNHQFMAGQRFKAESGEELKIITFIVWIYTIIHKPIHIEWTGCNGYYISIGKIGPQKQNFAN